MQTRLGARDYAASVVAVPPIALNADLTVNADANGAIIRHIEAGGVRILLYGGNANLYHFGLDDYRAGMEAVIAAAAPQTGLITSIGPDFGKAMAQAPIARDLGFKNVMLLPTQFPADPAGVANGVRRLAAILGHGLVLYLKRENYVDPDELARLVSEGAVDFVKYAVERADPAQDAYLDAVIGAIGKDRMASGMGETPIHDHLGRRALTTYTSGAVCIALRPRWSSLRSTRPGAAPRHWSSASRFWSSREFARTLAACRCFMTACGWRGSPTRAR